MNGPLIVTLKMDGSAQRFFDALRKEHFPKHVNYLNAHCTLFYRLPSSEITVQRLLSTSAKHSAMHMNVSGVDNIDNGVAYTISSNELQVWHLSLQEALRPWLTSRDRQLLRPHITVQNKVSAFKAFTLHKKLQRSFVPFTLIATGFSTWLYQKGPWKHVEDFNFSG